MTEGSTVTVDPLDEDGVGAVAIGTALWLVALIVLILMRGTLTASGSQWWIWVAATGALLVHHPAAGRLPQRLVGRAH